MQSHQFLIIMCIHNLNNLNINPSSNVWILEGKMKTATEPKNLEKHTKKRAKKGKVKI